MLSVLRKAIERPRKQKSAADQVHDLHRYLVACGGAEIFEFWDRTDPSQPDPSAAYHYLDKMKAQIAAMGAVQLFSVSRLHHSGIKIAIIKR